MSMAGSNGSVNPSGNVTDGTNGYVHDNNGGYSGGKIRSSPSNGSHVGLSNGSYNGQNSTVRASADDNGMAHGTI
jgi:hypothetical protein